MVADDATLRGYIDELVPGGVPLNDLSAMLVDIIKWRLNPDSLPPLIRAATADDFDAVKDPPH